MSSSDEYIIVTGSRNLDSGDSDESSLPHNEGEDASLRAMESTGISIIGEDEPFVDNDEPIDNFSQELLDEGGIEIVPNKDKEEEEAFL